VAEQGDKQMPAFSSKVHKASQRWFSNILFYKKSVFVKRTF